MMAVVTGFGVILAICASRSFAPASVCLASTTMTPVLPMMMVLFPPAPPRPAHTSGFSIFIVIGGGACGACCAVTEMASEPHTTTTSPQQRVFTCDIQNLSFRGENSTTSCFGEVIEKLSNRFGNRREYGCCKT